MNSPRTNPYRVLVVDDDPSIRDAYGHILCPPVSEVDQLEALISGRGDPAPGPETRFQMVAAPQGEDAVALQRAALEAGTPIQMAFIDMRMPPGWDGMRTAVALRAQDPSIYVVIATAFSDYDVNELQRALGHDVVLLRKPFNQEEVYQLARTLCQSWDTRRRLERVTAEMEAQVRARTAELDRRMTQQTALADIAARLVEMSAEEQPDDGVHWALSRLGRLLDADHCALIRFRAEDQAYELTFEWNAFGIEPMKALMAAVPAAQIMPMHARFQRGEAYVLPNLAAIAQDMPALEARLRGRLESGICLPLEIGGQLTGVLVAGYGKAIPPAAGQAENLLRTAGHMLLRALEAHESHRRMAEHQRLLRETQRAARIGHWRLDSKTGVTQWDDELRHLFGIGPQDQVGPALLGRMVHPEDWPEVERSLAISLETGQPHHMENRIRRGDGEERWMACWAQPRLDQDGRVTGLLGMVQDITERKRTETALMDSEARFRSIVETAVEGVWQVDQHWVTTYANRRMEEMLGYAPGTMLARPLTDFMDTASHDRAEALRTNREQAMGETHEFTFRRADGTLLPTQVSAAPILDARGQFAGATALVTDITPRARLEAALDATARFVTGPGGEDFCRELVRLAAQTLDLDYVHIARLVAGASQVRTEAAWLDGGPLDNWTYDLAGTPCAEVLGQVRRCIESGVCRQYPEDGDLVRLAAEGYVGEPIVSSRGQVLGLIVGVSRRPLTYSETVQSSLRILAARAATEWEQAEARRELEQERDTTRNILQTAEALIVCLDRKGYITLVNRKACDVLGYPEEELVGRDWFTTCLPNNGNLEAVREVYRKALTGDLAGSEYYENPVQSRDGRSHLIAWHNSVVRDAQGQVLGGMSAGMDITAQRQAEEALHVALTKYKVLFDSFPMGITVTDPQGQVLETNAAARRLLGLAAEEHAGRRINGEQWRILRPDGTPMPSDEYAGVRALREQRRVEDVEMGVVRPDGGTTWLSVTADLLPLEGYGVVVAYGDITARRQAEEQIRQMAYYDPLTGLPNRRLLMDRLGQALSAGQRSGEYGALMMLDLDFFKNLNDSQGHDVGDQLLVEVARRLTSQVRQQDTVARLGGDEYVLILADLGTDREAAGHQATALAEKIRQALGRPYHLTTPESPFQSSASLGVTLFLGRQVEPEALLKQADLALYEAKAAGRNTVRLYGAAAGG